MVNTLGSRSGAGNGRTLSPASLARRSQPGQSGNRSGQAAEYGDVIRLARALSLRAVERLGELMESEDERVAAVARNAVLDRAFGKPQPSRPEKESSVAERLAKIRTRVLRSQRDLLIAPVRRRGVSNVFASRSRLWQWVASDATISRILADLGLRGREEREVIKDYLPNSVCLYFPPVKRRRVFARSSDKFDHAQ